MATAFPDPAAAARQIADAFITHHVPYALGGAHALAAWGVPRLTRDVDVTVFVELSELPRVAAALGAAGVVVDLDAMRREAEERGMFVGRCEGMRIDVFVPDIPLYASAEARRRTLVFLGSEASFLAPEDLILFKLLFFRTKDLADIESLLAVCGADLDVGYVSTWLEDLVGADDERSRAWRRLCGPR